MENIQYLMGCIKKHFLFFSVIFYIIFVVPQFLYYSLEYYHSKALWTLEQLQWPGNPQYPERQEWMLMIR